MPNEYCQQQSSTRDYVWASCLAADRCMEGDRVEAERGYPREVDVHAEWKPEREAQEKKKKKDNTFQSDTPAGQRISLCLYLCKFNAINLRTIWGWYFLSIYGNIGESLWNWVYLIIRRCLKSWWYPKCIETTMVTTGNRDRWWIPTRRSDPRCWAPSVRLGEMSNDTVVGYRL